MASKNRKRNVDEIEEPEKPNFDYVINFKVNLSFTH